MTNIHKEVMKVDKYKQKNLYSEDIEKSVIICLAILEECKKYIKRLETKDFAVDIHKTIFRNY